MDCILYFTYVKFFKSLEFNTISSNFFAFWTSEMMSADVADDFGDK